MWYRRHECGLRMAVFFSAATAAGAFGGLLARGIAEMDGVGGRQGWAWIFILEGILTFIVGAHSLRRFSHPRTMLTTVPCSCGRLFRHARLSRNCQIPQ